MHVSFDFDYTLADSSEGTVVCANYALDALGMDRRRSADIKKTIGLSLERTFTALTGKDDAETAAAFKRYFLAHAEQVMLDHIRFYDHTKPALQALKRQRHYISIVSTKLRERIEEALDRDDYVELIDAVVGGGCVARNKPDPEGLLRAIQGSGLPVTQTVYVGDSVSDDECASRAGVAFIGVLTGTTAPAELHRWNPARVLDHVGELAASDLSAR